MAGDPDPGTRISPIIRRGVRILGIEVGHWSPRGMPTAQE